MNMNRVAAARAAARASSKRVREGPGRRTGGTHEIVTLSVTSWNAHAPCMLVYARIASRSGTTPPTGTLLPPHWRSAARAGRACSDRS